MDELLVNPKLQRGIFYWRLCDLITPPFGTIRLCVNSENVVTRVHQRPQRRHGELGRAQEHNPHLITAPLLWRGYSWPQCPDSSGHLSLACP